MRIIEVMNGWGTAPHLWPRFVFLPLSVKRYVPKAEVERFGNILVVGLFGFAFFIEFGG